LGFEVSTAEEFFLCEVPACTSLKNGNQLPHDCSDSFVELSFYREEVGGMFLTR
jgi:hypothetical protein